MTNRREVLQVGLAATALPFATSAVAMGERQSVSLYKVLYDTRFAASRAFAHRAAAHGLSLAAMAGDITPFWYDDLYHRWKRGAAAIAGLTGYGALFCLEQLAWDQRLRVVFRAEHTPAVAGCVRHAVEGAAELVEDARALAGSSSWAESMADLVARCPAERATRASAQVTSAAASAPLRSGEPLFSWVIAPDGRA